MKECSAKSNPELLIDSQNDFKENKQ